MKRAGALQKVMSDINRFEQAILDFQDKYHSLPGDMPNAESFWGSDANCPNTASNTVPKTATCNGNGDGTIGSCESATTCSTPTNTYEWFRAWQQLANAGMVDGTYTGVAGAGGSQEAVVGTNVPKSKIKGGGYTLQYFRASGGDMTHFSGTYGHIIHFGMGDTYLGPNAKLFTYNPVLTAAEALAIDSKSDDGLPAYGKVMGPNVGCNCGYPTDYCTASSTQYNLAYGNDPVCALIFVMPF
jgi:hypothetical protein